MFLFLFCMIYILDVFCLFLFSHIKQKINLFLDALICKNLFQTFLLDLNLRVITFLPLFCSRIYICNVMATVNRWSDMTNESLKTISLISESNFLWNRNLHLYFHSFRWRTWKKIIERKKNTLLTHSCWNRFNCKIKIVELKPNVVTRFTETSLWSEQHLLLTFSSKKNLATKDRTSKQFATRASLSNVSSCSSWIVDFEHIVQTSVKWTRNESGFLSEKKKEKKKKIKTHLSPVEMQQKRLQKLSGVLLLFRQEPSIIEFLQELLNTLTFQLTKRCPDCLKFCSRLKKLSVIQGENTLYSCVCVTSSTVKVRQPPASSCGFRSIFLSTTFDTLTGATVTCALIILLTGRRKNRHWKWGSQSLASSCGWLLRVHGRTQEQKYIRTNHKTLFLLKWKIHFCFFFFFAQSFHFFEKWNRGRITSWRILILSSHTLLSTFCLLF